MAYRIGYSRGKKASCKREKKPVGKMISIGERKNVRVEEKWFKEFKKRYRYADEVVGNLAFFKHQKGITAFSQDQRYLEEWAEADKERLESKTSSFDTADFFDAALERTYGKNKK